MSVILQDIRLVEVIRADRVAHVAHGDSEGTFPGNALGARVAPAAGEGGFGAGRGGAGVVVVFGDGVGVERGVDYILCCLLVYLLRMERWRGEGSTNCNLDARPVTLTELIATRWHGNPAPLMGSR